MANRKATFAKRQRETDLKDRAKQKEDRRSQKRGEVRESKGPQIAWDEAVHAVTSDELPSLGTANQGARTSLDAEASGDGDGDAEPAAEDSVPPVASASSASAKPGSLTTKPATAPGPASPRPAG
ncbi:MAG TPA: hypothetical protein VHN14_34625 [Kofleriaceae bacterium]|jgi:hypothetical protein|nr:hypothetical protein [Kofleriaceae bacterium]